jgi:hypothetical protein
VTLPPPPSLGSFFHANQAMVSKLEAVTELGSKLLFE